MGKAAPRRMEAMACRYPFLSFEEEEDEAVMRRLLEELRCGRRVRRATRLLENLVDDDGRSGTRKAWVRGRRTRRRSRRRGSMGGEVFMNRGGSLAADLFSMWEGRHDSQEGESLIVLVQALRVWTLSLRIFDSKSRLRHR